ncbi:ATP-binding cassette domain-containing protein [Catenulispora sp. NL8]|uniref:ATP-binding cassette domain-containing protein n=1 Tax=Catenulispora pinistramenti TaxID=2705254 RepID=A0ABS5KQX9_9ACTN|nr:ATP-binding cassette domain-containing protein [Catenulispora pinistramenti]MBS2548449.1 ATP-binding cassette domain-containing protein [Catenulispora pinistramenti]
MPETLLEAEGLRKRFGTTQALDGVDLTVPNGSIIGLLGPNGAGKTTMLRVLSTLTRPDAGRATIAGFDVVRDAARVRSVIGLAGQSAALDEKLTGYENLLMFGRLSRLTERDAKARATELLAHYDLAAAADKLVSTYSGGMRRRLDLISSLIVSPRLLFLDEPTTGLDPRSRNEIWATVRQLVADGTTVLLTTQYLDEADQLADRITIVDHGRVVADGTPGMLKSAIGTRVRVQLADDADQARAARALTELTGSPAGPGSRPHTIEGACDPALKAPAIVRGLDVVGIAAEDVLLHTPSLDEVFLTLTGSQAGVSTPAGVPADALEGSVNR